MEWQITQFITHMDLSEPEIRSVEEQHAVCITRRGYVGGGFSEAAKEGFAALAEYLEQHKLWDSFVQCIGLCPDDPGQIDHGQARYQAGAILSTSHEPQGEATIEEIPTGRYAVFVHRGPYDGLGDTWRAIYRDWLPSSGFELRVGPAYEAYLNDPAETAPEDLRTEISIPIL